MLFGTCAPLPRRLVILASAAVAAFAAPVRGQSLPVARLFSVFPPGATSLPSKSILFR